MKHEERRNNRSWAIILLMLAIALELLNSMQKVKARIENGQVMVGL